MSKDHKQRIKEFNNMNDTERSMKIHYAIKRLVDSDNMIRHFNRTGSGLDEIIKTLQHSLFMVDKTSTKMIEYSIADMLAMEDDNVDTTTSPHLNYTYEQREEIGNLTKDNMITRIKETIQELTPNHISDNQALVGGNNRIKKQ
ncbi:MAG TPA: hypothetical protein PLW93_00980 [Candidatus Absconditabacterales bacterium]|nr:hypothetical protein [Candidatus Absconditabacterales bacterium]HNG96825.1 hypothetical protein [Candidatus Absconditabacterales bacterium]